MKQVTGDLIEMAKLGYFDVIVHGCNCFCTMGAGIAKQIKAEFPEAYAIDCLTDSGDKNKLGTINYVYIPEYNLYVVNAYTQYDYRSYKDPKPCDYFAIRKVFSLINRQSRLLNPHPRIGYPKIGAGLAGGNWDAISQIIDRELEGLDHTLVVLP